MPEKREISEGGRCRGPGFSSPTPFLLSIFSGGWGKASSGQKDPSLQCLKAPLTLLQISRQLSDQTHARASRADED